MDSLFSWLSRSRRSSEAPEPLDEAAQPAPAELTERLAESEHRLRERSELLYDLQQHYSSEHFELQKCMRDLKIERMRNAGAYASLETTMERARALQSRIAVLKERLRRYESVEDEYFDREPIRIETPPADDEP